MASNIALNRHGIDALDVARPCAELTDEAEHVYGELTLCACLSV
jgi:hypothetical protein